MIKKLKQLLPLILSIALLPVLQPAEASASTKEVRQFVAAPSNQNQNGPVARQTMREAGAGATGTITVSLPIVVKDWPWPSFVGVEVGAPLSSGSGLLARAQELNARWARLNGRISWRKLQPTENATIDWSQLSGFEDELRALKAAGIQPLVIVDDNPYWAVISNPRGDGKPTSCAAIRSDRFGQFAQFMQQLVNRYSGPEFNVLNWELGNEIDVDPNLVAPDEVFGCWGDIHDEFYGGRRYGEMLKVVAPAMRAANPAAKIWMGGLLLANPNTTNPDLGKPEKFLEGVLVAGAGAHFDVLPFHTYQGYYGNPSYDYDWDPSLDLDWMSTGGRTIGKVRFLRSVMSKYGINKPVFLNETGFFCANDAYESLPFCSPQPDELFYQQQANHLVRIIVRALSEGVAGTMWYTLDGPGWRNASLLDGAGNPRPSFNAYKNLSTLLNNTHYLGKTDYGNGIEGYRFGDGAREVQALWVSSGTAVASVPQIRFTASYNRDGAAFSPAVNGANVDVTVGFQPVFVVLKP